MELLVPENHKPPVENRLHPDQMQSLLNNIMPAINKRFMQQQITQQHNHRQRGSKRVVKADKEDVRPYL
jgi:hypothetical protein